MFSMIGRRPIERVASWKPGKERGLIMVDWGIWGLRIHYCIWQHGGHWWPWWATCVGREVGQRELGERNLSFVMK